ncbi:MAG: TRAP transporter fused permease subunit [Pseudomonadota bacterium]
MTSRPGRITRIGSVTKAFLEIAYPLFAAYAVITSELPPLRQLAIFLSATLVLVFLKRPVFPNTPLKGKPWTSVLDGVLIALSILAGAYIYIEYPDLVYRVGVPTRMDVLLGIIATLLVLEGTRRASGWALVLIAIGSLVYTYFGAGFGIGRMTTFLYTTDQGIYGVALDVMMRYVVVFILFGAVMETVGGIDFFMKLSQIIAGRWKSGPALTAVISSAFMGTLSGSAVANVATTGSFTIPLMKRLGYQPHVAGSIETAASTGGQIMPPVMGAAAFLMAEFLGIPYLGICKAAALPAVLYFFAVAMGVYFYSEKLNVKKIDPASLPRPNEVLGEGYFLLPLATLIFFLVSGSTPVLAAFYATLTALLISFCRRKTWLTPGRVFTICNRSTYNIVDISIASACAGIIIGSLGSTGLSLKFSGMIVELSGGYLIVCLLLTMVSAIFLGMGLPTTIVYIILAVLVAPALSTMGVLPLAAHMFVFFFGIMSMVTPPVAFAAYAASAIAGSNFTDTGWNAFKLVLPSFIIAYVFVYNNSLLFVGSYLSIGWRFLVSVLGVVGMVAAIQGWLLIKTNILERLLFLIGGLLLILPGFATDLAGFGCLGLAIVLQAIRKERASLDSRPVSRSKYGASV